MNRVQINEKDVDSIFDLGCTSMVICRWKGVRVQNDNERKVFKNLHEEGNFGIIVKFLINLGVTRIIWGETRKSLISLNVFLKKIKKFRDQYKSAGTNIKKC